MNIIFALPLSLVLPIALLLFTGHAGMAEKLTVAAFLGLLLSVSWSLIWKRKES